MLWARRCVAGLAAAVVAATAVVGGPTPRAAASSSDLIWYLRDGLNGGAPTRIPRFGWNECSPVRGDWDGDGDDSIGAYCGGIWYLRDDTSGGQPDIVVAYGSADDTPVVGDWDGDGHDTIGVVDGATWHLRDSLTPGRPDHSFDYGMEGYLPVVGDWDGDGHDSPGVYLLGRPGSSDRGLWVLTDQLPGENRTAFLYGWSSYLPVAGDWDDDGRDDIGVVDGGTWHLRASRSSGPPTTTVSYGTSTYQALPGDWNGDGTDDLGMVETQWGASIHSVSAAELGSTWRPGCPVGPDLLRRVHLLHRLPDGRSRFGDIVVHRDVAGVVVSAFERLYAAGFVVERMVPVAAYGGNDSAAMAANDTSGFNCRAVTFGSTFSQHSFGWAIDINPIQNPYITGSTVIPASGGPFVGREPFPGTVAADGVVVRAFAAIGWSWGGSWSSPRDFMHFSLTGR